MYERTYLKQVKSRIEEPRQFIQVILGPRQVGKTTCCLNCPYRMYMNLPMPLLQLTRYG